MDIRDASKMKHDLEKDLLSLLQVFQRETGLDVILLNVTHIEVRGCGDPAPARVITGVEVRAELP